LATITVTRDDLDNTSEAEETLLFLSDGEFYEIDLSADNAKKFRDANAKYVKAARVVVARDATRRIAAMANGSPAEPETIDPAAVRAWAQSRGHQIGEKGRVPQHLVAQYQRERTAASA
jgi:hypothetical protein